MDALERRIGTAVALVLGLLASAVASATIVMTFDQLHGHGEFADGEYVDNYYDGGCGGSYVYGGVTCGGPDYGVIWTQAVAGHAPMGLPVADQPSPPNVMAFDDNSGAYMDVSGGFSGGFSFYYAAVRGPGSINLYSGIDGTGSLLATLALPVSSDPDCQGPFGDYSCWAPIGVSFSGIARSVDFSESVFYNVAFDNVTLGSTTPTNPVPEPAALGMFGLGALLIGVFVCVRRRVREI
jgi:hypothetical protein